MDAATYYNPMFEFLLFAASWPASSCPSPVCEEAALMSKDSSKTAGSARLIVPSERVRLESRHNIRSD